MGKDYLGKDQRATRDDDKEDKPIQGKVSIKTRNNKTLKFDITMKLKFEHQYEYEYRYKF